MKEIWKDINGYEGLYQVSNFGKIKRLAHTSTNNRFYPEVILHCGESKGYRIICLSKNKQRKTYRVCRLVALAFVPNDDVENKIQVGHKDESRNNDYYLNLEWVTPKENSNMPLHKERLSQGLAGKCNNKKEHNPMYGKHHSENAKNMISQKRKGKCLGEDNHKSIKIFCEGKIFNSITDCAKYYNMKTPAALSQYLCGYSKMPQKWKDRQLRYYYNTE